MLYHEIQNIIAPAGLTYGTRPIPSDWDYKEGALSLPDGSPLISYWIDAESKWYAATGPLQNRPNWAERAMPGAAGGQSNFWYTQDGGTASPGNNINSRPSITIVNSMLQMPADSEVIPRLSLTGYSLFAVLRILPANAGAGINHGLFSYQVPGGTSQNPLLYISGNNNNALATISAGASSGTVSDTTHNYADGVARLVGITWSPTRGITMRCNGSQLLADTTRTAAPPSDNQIQIASLGGNSTTGRLNGYLANIRICGADLSDPIYASALQVIEQRAMAMYGITA